MHNFNPVGHECLKFGAFYVELIDRALDLRWLVCTIDVGRAVCHRVFIRSWLSGVPVKVLNTHHSIHHNSGIELSRASYSNLTFKLQPVSNSHVCVSSSLLRIAKHSNYVFSLAPKESPPKESKENKEKKEGDDSALPAVPDVGLSDKPPLALNKKAAEDVAGSLKVHIKIALEIDIQITARIKGVST